ncbi:hypothetical protein XELAEV_18021974mg [Xenopus laevis]|uniref:Elongator complex protein 4 n=1 Tax=Xenopus laevis TaxID=8355 RepID=A0A974D442_XENLA|nr:hypothetical protein XELAEV_18021974mg [Xenopus laevis]
MAAPCHCGVSAGDEAVGMGISFKRKVRGKFPAILGTQPSVHNGQLLVSAGVPSLDHILGPFSCWLLTSAARKTPMVPTLIFFSSISWPKEWLAAMKYFLPLLVTTPPILCRIFRLLSPMTL